MNFKVLKTFCDATDTGSFSRAAQLNGVTQSAVSQQVASLERKLKVTLLNRGGGTVTLTEAGKAFYDGAREILRRWEGLLGEIRSAADRVRGVVRVGTIYSVGFDVLYPYVRRFLQAYPDVHLQIEYTRWSRINTAVIQGEMDLGVVAYPRRHRSLEILPLVQQELVAVFSPSHPLAGRSRLNPSHLEGEKFVAFEDKIPTRVHTDKALREHGVKVNRVMAFDNVETLKRAVEAGAGMGILPLDNVTREVAAGHLACARFRDSRRWVRTIGIIRRAGRDPSAAEEALVDLLMTKGPVE